MPDETTETPLARATAGQLRRAGFVVPEGVADDATTGFEVLVHQGDAAAVEEHQAAVARGDAFPAG